MSTLIHHVGQRQGVSRALDLGSGQGYLSRALAFQHDFEVLAVDMSEVQTKGAQKFDRRASKGAAISPKLNHVTETITPENVSSVLTRWSNTDDDEEKWLICGLHACGDLSTLIMRLFGESDKVISLVNVGCCYHYLSEGDKENGSSTGFPMSKILKETGWQMGTTARVLACHSPWQWMHDKKASMQSFEQHFFRALLQASQACGS